MADFLAPGFAALMAFAVVCTLLLVLPFVPAYREWRHPTDVEALPVSANYSSDIGHFARRLRSDAMAKLGRGPATGYEEFDFLPTGASAGPIDLQSAPRRLIARESIHSAHTFRSSQPLFVDGSVDLSGAAHFTALYATGDISLAAQSHIHDWAHAEGVLHVGKDGSALRRISAGTAVQLQSGVWFERLHAPTLQFGVRDGLIAKTTGANAAPAPVPGSFAELPDAVCQTPALYLIRGDCTLAAHSSYTGSLIVTGLLTISSNTTVLGDIKARGGIRMAENSAVHGAVICEKEIHIGKLARAWGPLVAETDIFIGKNVVIGLPEALTTVSALNIIASAGSTVHGTVWAHEIGMVKA